MALLNSAEETLLLHNPGCSKSRATLALLEERGAPFRVRPYLDEPLTRAELDELQASLGKSPKEWVRRGQAEYSDAGLDANSAESAVLEAMVQAPVLMERPIVVCGNRAAIGRPPQNVLEILD